MKSLDDIEGDTVLVTRDGIFSDVLSLYQNDFGKRYPIKYSLNVKMPLISEEYPGKCIHASGSRLIKGYLMETKSLYRC